MAQQQQQQQRRPITRQRLEAIRRVHLKIANETIKPLIAHHLYVNDVADLLVEIDRLGEIISLMAEASVKTAYEQDAEILQLVHANEQLRAELAASRETERGQ